MFPQVPHEFDLTRLTTREIDALEGDRSLVILPIGAIEQHGPHLPVNADSVVPQEILRRALAKRPNDGRVWVLPILPYGKSDEHTGFPGTFSLKGITLYHVLMDLGRSAHASGLRNLMFLNGHGGQPEVLDTAARDLRIELGDMMVFTAHPFRFSAGGEVCTGNEAGCGIHGGEGETSCALAVAGQDVHPDRYAPQIPGCRKHMKHLGFKGGASFSWLARDLSENGTIGDPRQASAEKGHLILDRDAEHLVEIIEEALAFRFDPPDTHA